MSENYDLRAVLQYHQKLNVNANQATLFFVLAELFNTLYSPKYHISMWHNWFLVKKIFI